MPEDKLTNNELKIYMDNINTNLTNLEKKFDGFCNKIETSYVHRDVFDGYTKGNDEKVGNNAKNIQKILWTTIVTLLGVVVNIALFIIGKWF